MLMGMAAGKSQLDLTGMRMEVEVDSDPSQGGRIKALRATVHLPRKCSEEQLKELQAAAALCPLRASLRPDLDVKVELLQPN